MELKKYMCVVCGWVYDEKLGAPQDGLPAGTRWEDVRPVVSLLECFLLFLSCYNALFFAAGPLNGTVPGFGIPRSDPGVFMRLTVQGEIENVTVHLLL